MFKKTPFFFVAMFGLAIATQAQNTYKYGHMNLGAMLELLPETKKANDELKTFADALGAKADSMAMALQTAAEALQREYDAGNLTPVQAQKRQAELQQQQETLQKFEQEANQLVSQRREELLRPILIKVDEAVKAVAKENGYAMIFDTSTGAMLFASEMDDVTALVKKKLGLN